MRRNTTNQKVAKTNQLDRLDQPYESKKLNEDGEYYKFVPMT